MNFLQCLRKSIERVKMWTMKNFATKKYVDEKIETVDLSAYATTDYVDENFATQRSVDEKLTAYATKKDIALLGEDADIPTAYTLGDVVHPTLDTVGLFSYITDEFIEETGGNFRIAFVENYFNKTIVGYSKPISIRHYSNSFDGNFMQYGSYVIYTIDPTTGGVVKLINGTEDSEP